MTILFPPFFTSAFNGLDLIWLYTSISLMNGYLNKCSMACKTPSSLSSTRLRIAVAGGYCRGFCLEKTVAGKMEGCFKTSSFSSAWIRHVGGSVSFCENTMLGARRLSLAKFLIDSSWLHVMMTTIMTAAYRMILFNCIGLIIVASYTRCLVYKGERIKERKRREKIAKHNPKKDKVLNCYKKVHCLIGFPDKWLQQSNI